MMLKRCCYNSTIKDFRIKEALINCYQERVSYFQTYYLTFLPKIQ